MRRASPNTFLDFWSVPPCRVCGAESRAVVLTHAFSITHTFPEFKGFAMASQLDKLQHFDATTQLMWSCNVSYGSFGNPIWVQHLPFWMMLAYFKPKHNNNHWQEQFAGVFCFFYSFSFLALSLQGFVEISFSSLKHIIFFRNSENIVSVMFLEHKQHKMQQMCENSFSSRCLGLLFFL